MNTEMIDLMIPQCFYPNKHWKSTDWIWGPTGLFFLLLKKSTAQCCCFAEIYHKSVGWGNTCRPVVMRVLCTVSGMCACSKSSHPCKHIDICLPLPLQWLHCLHFNAEILCRFCLSNTHSLLKWVQLLSLLLGLPKSQREPKGRISYWAPGNT